MKPDRFFILDGEQWKPIPGYRGIYSASNLGRIRSEPRSFVRRNGIKMTIRKRLRKLTPMWSGHLLCPLKKNGKTRMFYVHRLILLTFVGPCPFNEQGCHGDGNPTNNKLSNLRWDTQTGNEQDKIAHGTKLHGATASNAFLTWRKVRKIRELYTGRGGITQQAIADMFGVSCTAINSIIERKTWRGSER